MQNSRVHSQFGDNSSQQSRGYNGQPALGSNRIMCGDHQGYGITHFCSKIQCLKGLCQKCIKEHNQYHKERKEYAEIETIEDINLQCQQRLQNCMKEYSHEQEQIHQQILSEDQHQKSQQVLQKMNEAERQCQNIVSSYFDTVRKEYEIAQRKMEAEKQKINTQLQEIEQEKNKLSGFFRELQDNQFQVSSLQHVLKLDFSVFITDKLAVIGQYFEQLIQAAPHININFENIHRLIFDVCQNACFLTYSDQSPKQKSITLLRNEYTNNIRKASANTNDNIPNEINFTGQRNVSLSPFKGINALTHQNNHNNNNSSQFSQLSDRNYNEFAIGGSYQPFNNRNSQSTSPTPDNRLAAQQVSAQVKPNLQPKIPHINGLDNINQNQQQQQQDDRYTPVSKKMKMKIFDTKANHLSSPRIPYNSSQQHSLKQSMALKNEESKQQGNIYTPTQSNVLQQSGNTNNSNITPNFLNSKFNIPNNTNNTGFSSFNSNVLPSNTLGLDNQLSSRNNIANSIQPTNQDPNRINSNYNSFNPTSQNENLRQNNNPNNFTAINSQPPKQNQNNSQTPNNVYNTASPIYQENQKQDFNTQPQQPQPNKNVLTNNNNQQLNNPNSNNLLSPEINKSNFGQSINLNHFNNNPNNQLQNSNQLNNPNNNHYQPSDISATVFNRGNSFNPMNNAQSNQRENNHLSQLQNKNLPQINEYPQRYENQQYQNNSPGTQFQPQESDEYQDWQNEQKDIPRNPTKNNYAQQQEEIYNNNNNLFTKNNMKNNNNNDSNYFRNNNNNQIPNANTYHPNNKKGIQDESQQYPHSQMEEKALSQRDFEVSLNNYFRQDCNYQYLHFFQPKSNAIHIINIQDLKQASNGISNDNYLKFYAISMKTDDPSFTVPRFHKSITLPDGSIYLLGGISPSSNHSRIVYKYEFTKNYLKPVSEMITGRSGFGCVYSPFNNSIYVIGGACDEEGVTSQCERYDITNNKWTQISYLNNPTFNPTVCYFTASNGKNYIYKFGGKLDDNNLDTTIERYDLQTDRWEIIPTNVQIPLLLSSANCCQINGTTILVFGGTYSSSQEKTSTCFLFCVDPDPVSKQQLVHNIRGINQIELQNTEGFSSQQCFIHDNQFYTLQNVSEKKNPEIIYLDRKRIICFNSYSWMVLNNIELLEKNN